MPLISSTALLTGLVAPLVRVPGYAKSLRKEKILLYRR